MTNERIFAVMSRISLGLSASVLAEHCIRVIEETGHGSKTTGPGRAGGGVSEQLQQYAPHTAIQ